MRDHPDAATICGYVYDHLRLEQGRISSASHRAGVNRHYWRRASESILSMDLRALCHVADELGVKLDELIQAALKREPSNE